MLAAKTHRPIIMERIPPVPMFKREGTTMSRRVVTLSQLTQLLWGEHGESERETFKKV